MRSDEVRPVPPLLPSPVPEHPVDVLLTPERCQKYRQVLARRVKHICVVIEDCHDPHNATAVIRSCDAYGIHHVHVTTDRNKFKISRSVSQGTHRYIDLHVHKNIEAAYEELREQGYTIYVSDLGSNTLKSHTPDDLNKLQSEQKIALVFGSESKGVTDAARAGADAAFLVPMRGFTQSLNLSVTVASTIYRLREQGLIKDAAGNLSAQEQIDYYDQWVSRHAGKAAALVKQAHEKKQSASEATAPLIGEADPRAELGEDKKGNPIEIFDGDKDDA